MLQHGNGTTANNGSSSSTNTSSTANNGVSELLSIANGMPNFDQIVRETLLAFASEHAASLMPSAAVAIPAARAEPEVPKVETVDTGVGARTPTPQKRGVHTGSSPVMWAHRHQSTQAEGKHRRSSSPLAGPAQSPASFRPRDPTLQAALGGGGAGAGAGAGAGVDAALSPMGFPTGRRNVASAGISPMPQYYGNDAGLSPMPQQYGHDAGVSPMPQAVGRDAGLSPMPQHYGNDAGVSPMPRGYGSDADVSPMPRGYGRNRSNDAGVSPMHGGHEGGGIYLDVVGGDGRDAGVSPMPQAAGRDAGLSPMPHHYGNDAGVSPMPGARRLGDTDRDPVDIEHSLPTWWTRLHESDADAGPVVSKSHITGAAAVTRSLDAQISEGEILLSSDGECFPPRQLAPDAVGPDLFQTVLGTTPGLGGGGDISSSASSQGEVGHRYSPRTPTQNKKKKSKEKGDYHNHHRNHHRDQAYDTVSEGQLSLPSGLSEGEVHPQGGGGGRSSRRRARAARDAAGGGGGSGGGSDATDMTDSDAATVSEGQLLSDC